MKKLFIHFPLFRLVSPFATGTLVYLLILLVNNNVDQVKDSFLGQELYVCIALSYVIQEFSRISLILSDKVNTKISEPIKMLLQFILSISISIVIVTVIMNIYYKQFLGYSPNFQELLIFNTLFAFVSSTYLLLYKGHELLFKVNSKRLENEEHEISSLLKEFETFTSKINSELLFESLDTLIVMKDEPELAEEFTDNFAALYRYQLLLRSKELISLHVEYEMLLILLEIYSHLPYRKAKVTFANQSEALIVPGSLLDIIEKVIRSTIPVNRETLHVHIKTNENHLSISYELQERNNGKLGVASLSSVSDKYAIYTDDLISISEDGNQKTICLPKLHIYESSDH